MTEFRVAQKAGIRTSYRLGIPQDVGCAKREAQGAVVRDRLYIFAAHISTATPTMIRYTANGTNPRRRTHAMNQATAA